MPETTLDPMTEGLMEATGAFGHPGAKRPLRQPTAEDDDCHALGSLICWCGQPIGTCERGFL